MNRKHRKVMTISVVLLWIFTAISVGLVPLQRDFDWSSFGTPGVMLAVALTMTIVWWALKDDITD